MVLEKIKALKDVAGECFLFEAVEYLAFGVLPLIFYDPPFCEDDGRYSEGLFCDGIHRGGTDQEYNQYLINRLVCKSYSIGRNPELDAQYNDARFCYNSIEYHEAHGNNTDEADFIVEFLDKQKKYNEEYNKIIEPFQKNLYEFLSKGMVTAKGFVSMKYDNKTSEWNEIYEDFKSAMGSEKQITRHTIPQEQWIYKNIDFNDSALQFDIGSDRYKYDFILVDFYKLCEIYPREYNTLVNGILNSHSIAVDNEVFHIKCNIDKEVQDFFNKFMSHSNVNTAKCAQKILSILEGGQYPVSELHTFFIAYFDTRFNIKKTGSSNVVQNIWKQARTEYCLLKELNDTNQYNKKIASILNDFNHYRNNGEGSTAHYNYSENHDLLKQKKWFFTVFNILLYIENNLDDIKKNKTNYKPITNKISTPTIYDL